MSSESNAGVFFATLRHLSKIGFENPLTTAIIGALLGAYAQAYFGYSTLHETFVLQIKQDLLRTLSSDIRDLETVELELESNIQLLLSDKFVVDIGFEPYLPDLRKVSAETRALLELQGMDKLYRVTKIRLPDTPLLTDAWWRKYSVGSSEIAIPTAHALSDLYRRMERLNALAEEVQRLAEREGFLVTPAYQQQVVQLQRRFNDETSDLKGGLLVSVRNLARAQLVELQAKLAREQKP